MAVGWGRCAATYIAFMSVCVQVCGEALCALGVRVLYYKARSSLHDFVEQQKNAVADSIIVQNVTVPAVAVRDSDCKGALCTR